MSADAMNPFAERLAAFVRVLKRRRLDCALVCGEANVRALTSVACDNACLLCRADGAVAFHTDFRYVPMVHRTAPWLEVRDIAKVRFDAARVGFEGTLPASRYLALAKGHPEAEFVDVAPDLLKLRAVKTAWEQDRIRAAEALNDEIWREASAGFQAGMTEREMARAIRLLMVEKGDGEAFETIVCVGANAAECHHVPDGTVWNGREPVLVDMGVKLDGYCSDMTRNLVPKRAPSLYRRVHALVLEANWLATAAVRPGITGRELDAVARRFLTENGFGNAFGHSLGHGVGLEIHEAPFASRRSRMALEPGMCVTIEPGVYLEGNLGVRIEDLVLVTPTGCEVLSRSPRA